MDASERGMADDNKANNKVVSFEGPEAKLSTLSTLWKVAIQKFSKENHVSISELELEGDFPSTGSGVEKANLMWQKARHSDDRKDKIVTAVGGCLGWIDMAVEYLKDAVPDGYGTPAKIVAGTISYMIKAANKMTSDFDLIETTFEGLNNALRDIGLLKNHSTREDHFTYRLMEIFLAMFDFCSYTTTLFRKHTRRNMYLRALFKGNNEKIQQKCDHVKKAIQQFRDTVPVKSYATVLETNEKIDELPNNLIVAIQSMKSSDLQLLLGRQKPTFKDILENFRKRGVNVDAKATMEKQMELIKIRSVADTFSWIREAPTYSSWLKGQPSPFLYVSGSSGAGKTYFMYKCCRILEDGPKATSIATQSDKVKQIASVACFFFEPGKEDAQSFRNILATLVLQIAEQDVRLCETMAKDLEKVSKDDEAGMVTTLWETMILKKFERTSEASPRTLYILLDGIDQMKDEYFSDMMDRFKALGPDKHSIRVMLSGSRDMGNKVDLKSLSKIDLDEMTKSKGDIAKVINDRIHKSAALNNLGLHFKEKITDKFNHWASSVMSSVDLMLSLIEQNGGDRYAAAKLIEEAETPEWLYRAMIRLVKVNRSDLVRKSVETLYSWCTYAKQPLSVDELQHIWSIDTNLGKFDIREEIQGKSFSLLCIETLLPGQYDAASSLTNHDVVSFRQPAIRDFIEAEGNDMIEDPLQEKVNIFKTLCAILSSGSADGDPLRKRLQSYACRELIRHLDDIDVKATSSEQGRDVVEGIVRVLCNENDVCSVFETAFRDSYRFSVDFDLYESSGLGIFNMAGKLTAWAKKMIFHDEEDLSLDATDWVEASIIMPQRMLETLGCGHLENWVKAVTVSEATVPYMLAYRCLYIVGIFEDPALKRHMDLPVLSPDEVMTEYIAKIMLRYARKVRHFPRVKFAKARIATALLLSEGNDEDHDKALQFYTANIVDKSTPGPEKFYSLLGIAEYYDRKARGVTDDEAKETWIKVQEYTSKALQQLAQEKGALGSELDNGRCLAAFLLKANASMRLADDAKALDTCEGLLQAFDLGQVQWGFQLLHALTMVVEIHYRHGRYARLVHQVLNQKTPLKCAWFCDRTAIMNHSVYAVDAFREAAVRSRRVDMSIRLCEEAIEYWRQNDSTMAIFLQDNLAVIYGQDARTTVMAERVLDNIIETIQKDYTLLKGGILRSVFPRMVDILSEKCHLSQSEVTKRESVMKLTGLINEFKGTAVVEPITFAVALIALARMQKDCPGYGVARAMVEADRAFKLCIADLEDSTGANDGLAFCALARVLMFAGYDVDASVCLSLQFSEVRDYDDSESRSQTPDSALKRWNTNSSRGTGSTKSDEESGQDDDTSSTVSTTQDGGVDNHDTPNVIPEEPASNSRPLLLGPPEVEPVVNNEDQIAATSDETDAIEETRLTNGTIQIIDEAPANASTIKESQHANGTHVEGDVRLTNGARMTADGEGAPNPVDSVQDAQPVSSSAASVVMAEALDTVSKSRAEKTMSSGRDIAQEEEVSDKMRDVESDTHKEEEVPNPREGEDVFEYGKFVYCDGRCSLNPITAWPLTEKYYFCNDCVDVAFCGKCYPTQTQYYEDYGQGFWYKVCWAKHEFLEAPIDGWRGVRNGMIRIGDKEKSWFEWLDEVKKKWQKKMNEFGEGGLNSNERIGT